MNPPLRWNLWLICQFPRHDHRIIHITYSTDMVLPGDYPLDVSVKNPLRLVPDHWVVVETGRIFNESCPVPLKGGERWRIRYILDGASPHLKEGPRLTQRKTFTHDKAYRFRIHPFHVLCKPSCVMPEIAKYHYSPHSLLSKKMKEKIQSLKHRFVLVHDAATIQDLSNLC